MDFNSFIKSSFKRVGVDLSLDQMKCFYEYSRLLIEWNKKINLTNIVSVEEIIIKHFVDSTYMLKYVKIKEQAKVIDIGTGAGFPGVVLKILRPDINLYLLDSLNKRLVFLNDLLSKLNLSAEVIHSRAEDGAQKSELREKFDVVTSRAVAKMKVLIELCAGYVALDGVFCPLKGPYINDEIKGMEKKTEVLGFKLERIEKFLLQDDSARTIAIFKKIFNTPAKYPRRMDKIIKQVL